MRQRGGRRFERSSGGRPWRSPDAVVLYGWHSALAALNNPNRQIRKVLASANALAKLAGLGVGGLPPPTDLAEIDRAAGAGAVHQGIVVFADPLPEVGIEDVAEMRLLVVLDQVTDPQNVGAIVRSAAAFGAGALVLAERHSPAESGVLAKAASGGLEHVALVRVKNLARTLDQLGDSGFLRLGLDSSHSDTLATIDPGDRVALVLGAEGSGMRRLTREKCDRLVRLATPGAIKSLNVSNAAAIALYELTRKRT
jgi:23S rRNA (guanosine2251-2'-O)-methyltransferase